MTPSRAISCSTNALPASLDPTIANFPPTQTEEADQFMLVADLAALQHALQLALC
jgi:hypothetical protein